MELDQLARAAGLGRGSDSGRPGRPAAAAAAAVQRQPQFGFDGDGDDSEDGGLETQCHQCLQCRCVRRVRCCTASCQAARLPGL